MALIKFVDVADSLEFDLTEVCGHNESIRIDMIDKGGKKIVMRISTNRAITVKHYRKHELS
jgi:hypothetical protein